MRDENMPFHKKNRSFKMQQYYPRNKIAPTEPLFEAAESKIQQRMRCKYCK
jgi:hypothetical protein